MSDDGCEVVHCKEEYEQAEEFAKSRTKYEVYQERLKEMETMYTFQISDAEIQRISEMLRELDDKYA